MPDDNDKESGKEFRQKLEDALAENKDLKVQLSDLQSQVLMPTLNKRQRRSVLRELAEDKLDINEENVKAVAEDLGYKLEPEPPPASTSTADQTQSTIQPQQQPQLQSQQQPPPNSDGDIFINEQGEVMVSLASMNAIDQAHFNATHGRFNPDLETEMRNAKSPEELRDIIRTKGAGSGLVHEWDDQ